MAIQYTAMEVQEEQELFEKVRQRDERALEQLIRIWTPMLSAFVNRIVTNPEDTSDILQDTFVKIWEKSRQFKGEASPRTWATRIALNLSYSHLRRRKRWHHVLLDEVRELFVPDNTQVDFEKRERRSLLQEGLQVLTPRQRAVFHARIDKDLPFREVALAVGCSENAAKVHFHEAKKRLTSFVAERT